MEGYEIDACLKSMEILVDTREQPSDKTQKRYDSFQCPYHRQTLDYGDYTYNFTLPNGEKLFMDDERVAGDVVIERKMSLEELSGCLCQQRSRFEREFERASKYSTKVYLLVEDANWEKIYAGRYNTKFNSKAYIASLTAFMARYDITPIFCKSEVSGKLIREILYRELKERLEDGFYG